MLRWSYKLPLRFRSLFRKSRVEQELSGELHFHLERLMEEKVEKGMTPEEARYAALRELGGVEQIKEECRDMRRVNYIENFIQDVRYGLRQLRRSPGFTAVGVITLALGIGANSAIFSVVNAVLLEPLPYPDSNRLVMVWEKVRLPTYQNDQNDPAPGNFSDLRRQTSAFEGLAAIQDRSFNLTGAGEPVRVEGEAVSASLFSLLRIRPALGRVFNADEDVPGGTHVVVMGYGLWVNRFGADSRVLNQSIPLDGVSYKVVGIMPRDFLFPDPANFHTTGAEDQLWVPIALSPSELANHGSHYLQGVLARLKPRVTLAQAQAEVDGVARRLSEQYPRSNTGVGVNLMPLRDRVVGKTRSALWILFGAVGLILLMACANVANLLLARASTRSRELAVRVALGASRMRILGQLLTESLLLALVAGALGVLLAAWGVRVLLRFSPAELPLFGEIGVNGAVLTFTLLISLVAGLVFGISPALAATRTNTQDALKEGARETPTGARRRMRNLLIVAEIALGVIVLAGAGLLLRSFLLLERAPLGFQPESLLTFRIIPRAEKYSQLSRRAAFYQLALERIGALPGVKSAAAVSFMPLTFYRASKGFSIEGRPAPEPGEIPMASYDVVSPGYFRVMRIPFIEGRDVSWSDTPRTLRAIVINQAMARTCWPDEDPLGRRIKEGLPGEPSPWLTVVGVVGNIRDFDVASLPRPTIYFPISQFDAPNGLLRDWVVRTDGNPIALAPAVRETVWSIDKDLPVSRMRTMEGVRSLSLGPQTFNLLLLGLFACLALVLAGAGVHCVTAYSIAQRTHEIGIRMALGAGQADVLKLVVGQGARLAFMGATIGLAGALALNRLMESLLYGVSATDPLTFVSAPALLCVVALVASYIPARRATKVDPMVALRYE